MNLLWRYVLPVFREALMNCLVVVKVLNENTRPYLNIDNRVLLLD